MFGALCLGLTPGCVFLFAHRLLLFWVFDFFVVLGLFMICGLLVDDLLIFVLWVWAGCIGFRLDV